MSSSTNQFGIGWLFFIVIPFSIMALMSRCFPAGPLPDRCLLGVMGGSIGFFIVGMYVVAFRLACGHASALGMFYFSAGMFVLSLIALALLPVL